MSAMFHLTRMLRHSLMLSLLDKMTHSQTAKEYLATIGASINRLSSTINNLTASAVSTEVAYGRVVDADYALETMNFAKQLLLGNTLSDDSECK